MKLCIDINDKYEKVLNKLSEKQKEQLIKGFSSYANGILGVLETTDEKMFDTMLRLLTAAMNLVGQMSGNEEDDENEED
jgi:hemerythrin-like domain-containing protein